MSRCIYNEYVLCDVKVVMLGSSRGVLPLKNVIYPSLEHSTPNAVDEVIQIPQSDIIDVLRNDVAKVLESLTDSVDDLLDVVRPEK